MADDNGFVRLPQYEIEKSWVSVTGTGEITMDAMDAIPRLQRDRGRLFRVFRRVESF